MQTTMPDNMGFARRSITDMLPDEIAEADMEAMCRYVQNEGMGLREYRCAECGRTFTGHVEHKYKRAGGGKPNRMYCSYRCFRVQERKDEERFRKRMLNAWAEAADSPESEPMSKLERARAKLEKWKTIEASPEFAEMRQSRQKEIRANVAKWQARVVVLEEAEG